MTYENNVANWTHVIEEGFIPPVIAPSTTLHDAVNIAANAVEKHLIESPAVRAYLTALPKGPDTDCPDSPVDELVRYIADQKGEIDKSDPALALRFMERYVRPIFEMERAEVFYAILQTSDTSDEDIQLFVDCEDLASMTDHVWATWFNTIVVPFQSLDAVGKERYEQLVKGTLAPYDYTIFDYDSEKGCVNRRTWARAFPDEISEILNVLDSLVTTPIQGLSEYFTALRNAYACVDIAKLEELWAEVDKAWIRIPSTARFVPVHGMESGYEHPFGVSPEFRLEVRTPEARELIMERRGATLAHAAAFGLSNKMISDAVQKLERIDISVFVSALRAGVCLNFRYAGQAVPNRQDVVAEGGRIFLDKSASPRAAKRYAEKLTKHCVSSTAEVLVPLVTETSQLAGTATHEYAHPVGRTAESDKALGSEGMKLCEEGKATLLGILAEEHRDPTPERRLEIVANSVGRVIRFMDKTELENSTFAPYVRENLIAATTLFDTGVMALTQDGVAVDVEAAGSPAWFDALRTFNRGVLNAYKAKDKAALIALTERYCDRERPDIAGLIAWVNR
ncbi:MAG: hypothetical protein Q8R25_01535 [bacterium]|nr:hypothetical protein [bacterium]